MQDPVDWSSSWDPPSGSFFLCIQKWKGLNKHDLESRRLINRDEAENGWYRMDVLLKQEMFLLPKVSFVQNAGHIILYYDKHVF